MINKIDSQSQCFTCSKALDNEVCLFDNQSYHKYCCGFCKHSWAPAAKLAARRPTLVEVEDLGQSSTEVNREPSPPPCPRPVRSGSNPRKLSFLQITSFEATNDSFKCFTCSKPIQGPKFLSKKLGEFDCFICHSLNGPKCFMCGKLFDVAELVYKDDEENKCCQVCIGEYHEKKKSLAYKNK